MEEIRIIEVGPRDGFQNLPEYIPLAQKLHVIDGLMAAGVKHMQITSFVSAKAIPQMKDAKELAGICLEKYPEADLFALIPNLKGAQVAWEVGMRSVAYVISLSESHNKANINRTHEQSLAELSRIREEYPELRLCVDIATTFGCPFEGKQGIDNLLGLMEQIVGYGVNVFNLCDTVGVADPAQVRRTIRRVKEVYPAAQLQVHIHDTRGMGLANTLAAIEAGVRDVQSSIGGLGGCPFAPGASGNTSTEDLVYMLEQMGMNTGIRFNELLQVTRELCEKIPGNYSGHQIRILS